MDKIIDFHVNLLKEHYQNNISPYDEKIIREYRDKLIDLQLPYFRSNDREKFVLLLRKRIEEELGVS